MNLVHEMETRGRSCLGERFLASEMEFADDGATYPRTKKRRSSTARRVSFAQMKTVHVFQRDQDRTPSGATPPLRRSPRLAEKRKRSQIQADDQPAFGSVDDEAVIGRSHIEVVSPSSLPDDDVTLDSSTFLSRLSALEDEQNNEDGSLGLQIVVQEEADQRKPSWSSDMSLTDQTHRRPVIPSILSPPASVGNCQTMQCTEVVDAVRRWQMELGGSRDTSVAERLMEAENDQRLEDVSFKPTGMGGGYHDEVGHQTAAEDRDTSCCTNEAVVSCVAEVFGGYNTALRELLGRCSAMELRISDRVVKGRELAALREECKLSCGTVEKLKFELESLEKQVEQYMVQKDGTRQARKKRCVLQAIQQWPVQRINSNKVLKGTYNQRVNQSIALEGNGLAQILVAPNQQLIGKGFPHTNAAALFECCTLNQKLTIAQLPLALERTSDVITNMIHIAREAEECRIRYTCLDKVAFSDENSSGLCLRFTFHNYRMRIKVGLLFQLQVGSGEYPKGILPSDIHVEYGTPDLTIVEEELKSAILVLQAGYKRFHRVCACVSSFL